MWGTEWNHLPVGGNHQIMTLWLRRRRHLSWNYIVILSLFLSLFYIYKYYLLF